MYNVYKYFKKQIFFLVCEFLCPTLISMFGPWLEPWYEGWNSEHRSLKLPWLATDTSIAALMVDALVECITFVLDTMPGTVFVNNSYMYIYIFFLINKTKSKLLIL